MNPADRTFTTILPDDNSEPKGMQAMLRLDETVHQNAQHFFETARKQKAKTKGATDALEETNVYLKRARRKSRLRKVVGLAKLSGVSAYGLKIIAGQ